MRPSPILLSACVVALLALYACSGVSPTPGAAFASTAKHAANGANLILNGDAELGDATSSGHDSVTIPGWVESGLPTVVAYGVSGFPAKSSPGAGDGRNFFAGGPFVSSTLTQKVDVSSASGAIDGGAVKCTLSGNLGGNARSRDSAQVTATFLGAGNTRLGSVTIGPVTPDARKDVTGFLALSARAAVPPGTRAIALALHFVMYETFVESVTLNNGYADNLSLVLSTPVTPPALPPTPTPVVPKFDHIFFVYFENEAYGEIIGNTSQAPFLNQMARKYAVLGNYYALVHPSDPNYVLQAAGSTYGVKGHNFATDPIPARHLADLVERAGGSWKQYMESAHGACDKTLHGYYYPDDGPYMWFDDVRYDAARCKSHVVPFEQFSRDLASDATTPRYAWLSPDDCDDMESCGVKAGDDFLKNAIMAPLLKSPAWTQHDTLLIVAWDEDNFTPVEHVPAIFVSRTHVKNGFVSPVLYTHYSVLKTIETSLGLPNLTKNDYYATLVNDVWK